MRAVDLKFAAALAGPVEPGSGDFLARSNERPEPAAVLEILRANKVPLIDIDPPDKACSGLLDPILVSGPWLDAVQREKAERDALTEEFAGVSSRLRARGIMPVLFKSPGGIPYRSSNVDLLVPPGRMDEAARLLAEMGHLRFPHYREDHKLLFRRFRFGRSVICIHLHDAVSWGKVMILPGGDVSKRSRAPGPDDQESGFRVAAGEDLLIITMAHALYETDQIRLSDLRVIRLAASDPGFDPAQVVSRVSERGWTGSFTKMLLLVEALERSLYGASRLPPGLRGAIMEHRPRHRSFASRRAAALDSGSAAVRLPYRMPKWFTEGHYLLFMMTNADRSGDERIADLIATCANLIANRLRWRCRPAVVISLSGLDGSGKSSALEKCLEAMRLCEVPVRAVWSRGGFTSWMERAKRAARTAMPATIPGPGQMEAKRLWFRRPVPAMLFASAVVIEQALHYLVRVRLPGFAGTSILCDRFAWDTQADLEAKLESTGRVAALSGALVTSMAPHPDLAILLRIEPVAALRRKPGDAHMSHLLPAQALALDRLAERHRLVVIDADRPAADVIDEVIDLCLRASFRRFGKERG